MIRAGVPLPPKVFAAVRREMELAHCKWDAQVGDLTTLADFPIILGSAEFARLQDAAERLTAETLAVERELLERPDLWRTLALPRRLRVLFRGGKRPTAAAARVMRFDFHLTRPRTGSEPPRWLVSEVNSDVPGGYTEATSFTRLMAENVSAEFDSEIGRAKTPGDPAAALVQAIAATAGAGGRVALVNAPGHMEDHQVVAYLVRALRGVGLRAEAVSIHQLPVTRADAIVRFYQAEWLARLPRRLGWERLFVGGDVPVVNPGTAALTESKRLPLVWDRLATPTPAWRRFLPETRPLGWWLPRGFIAKSAYCNTGDTVTARMSWEARRRRHAWVAQRRFDEVPFEVEGRGEFTACIGVYTVDGKAAGAYGRVVPRGRFIDAFARDAAVLIER